MSIKGFSRHPNGKAHPVHGKKGVSEKEFSVTEKGMDDRIEVKIDPAKGGIGRKYYDSLNDEKKRNLISSFTGIAPKDVDLSDLQYDDLDKWTRKGINDMAILINHGRTRT